MPKRTDISSILIIGVDEDQPQMPLTRQCGLALGELFQDESEKRLLFMIRHGATAEERACVHRWARERHLKLVFVNAEGLAS